MISLAPLLWLQAGRWSERRGIPAVAENCYRNAAHGTGDAAAEAACQLARRLFGQSRYREAAEICEGAVGVHARNARLWCSLGAARRHLAQMPAARAAYERALACDENYAEAHSNLGEWHLASGDAARALECFQRALGLDDRLLEAMNNRVAALYELGRFSDAEAAAREAIAAYPDAAALHVNLGVVLLHSGKARPALKSFRRALECDPASPEALMNLATLSGETTRLADAVVFIEREIAAKGPTAQRLASLALAQQARGDNRGAEATCRRVIEMQPGNVSALVTLAGCLGKRADHRGAIQCLEQALAANPTMPAVYSNIAFDSTYLHDMTAAQVFECHRGWARRFENRHERLPFAHGRAEERRRRLRIGYVSGDFGRHPVGFLLRDVVRRHDKTAFEIYCYAMMRADDEITVAIRECADAWVDALLMSDDELATRIREDGVDLLVDLSGHTAYNRLPSFALRPAPIQATWIGYFHSTGLDSIDYFITDPYTSPPDSGQLFSETPVWLPHSRFCYAPPDYAPDVAPAPLLEAGHVTFGSFNRLEKLVDPVLDAWAEVLDGVPGSRLLLKAGGLDDPETAEELRTRFAVRGLASERLVLRGASAHPVMLTEYADVDLALDTFPFNGGMTTLEALWMGVPVVAIAGASVVSRQTFSILANLGLERELSFPDVRSYVDGAIALARDGECLARLRTRIRPLMDASPIRQPEAFVRDLEALYLRMWQSWAEGGRLPSDVAAQKVPDGMDRRRSISGSCR